MTSTAVIDTVHVIFKTHLDIGFTDFAAKVVKTYFKSFIPKALDTAEQLAKEGGEAQFVWTVASWLVYEYLEQATPAERRRMERAIRAGQINWLGLPFTTHTELMDASLFEFGLSLAQDLDRRYGKKTIAAKMTDVTGHTIGMVPLMAKAGIRFLHIGVNAASAVPKTPPLFDWTLGQDSVRVMVHATYGGATVLPGFRHALYFAHTNDNHGPQPVEEIKALFARLKTEYPGARIVASTLNAYAAELMKYKRVPKYRKEIGDNWIRGVGTDPLKVAQLRLLMFLRTKWLWQGEAKSTEKRFHAFSRNLLLVAEHTWGLDEKTHLNDFKNYEARDFARLRKTAAARKMEKSWNEQRGYIRAAVKALGPGRLQHEAKDQLGQLLPQRPDFRGLRRHDPAKPIECGSLAVRFSPQTGAIIQLTDSSRPGAPREWASLRQPLGQLSYTAYSQADYDRYFRQYARDVHLHGGWIVPDLTKPGMPRSIRHTEWTPRLKSVHAGLSQRRSGGWDLLAELTFPAQCSRRFGAPRRLFQRWHLFGDRPEIEMTLSWFDKPACRLPEALWMQFAPQPHPASTWWFKKLRVAIDPTQVTEHGGRQLHAVDFGVYRQDTKRQFFLFSPQAPLVAPGREDILDFSTRQPEMRHGVRFNLYNNLWGTNFPMWYDEDAQFRFNLAFM